MAFNNNVFFQEDRTSYINSLNCPNTDYLCRPRIVYGDQVSPGLSTSSDTQSSITTTGGMSPDTTMEEDIDGNNITSEPYLEITEEPADEFRFRYQSEMQGAHGAILGKRADKHKKTFPSVKLHNFKGTAIIRCTLATANTKGRRSVHAHRLVAKQQDKEKDDPHDISVGPQIFEASFQNMVIIHIEKKKVVEVLEQKITNLIQHRFPLGPINISPTTKEKIREQAQIEAEKMDTNQVSLKFEALVLKNNQLVDVCPPVHTGPINNLKSHLRGKLKICRIDKHISSCRGGEEVFVFVEKVAKKNIQVQFYELIEDKEIWSDYAKFGENDVHHQYGIVFRTPPYRNPDITRNVQVYIRLVRPSDGGVSDPIEFQYKPDHVLKRRRASNDLPMEELCLNEVNNKDLRVLSPRRSPDTTQTMPDCLNRSSVFSPDLLEMLQKSPDDIVNQFESLNDIDMMFNEDIMAMTEPLSLPSNPSIRDELSKLPTPDAEMISKYLSNLSSSGDFSEYKKAVMEGGLMPADTDIQFDGGFQMRKRTLGIAKEPQPFTKKPMTTDDYINKGLLSLNRILLKKKRTLINKNKFTKFIKDYFSYPLDEKCNRVLHKALYRGEKDESLSKFIDFITRLSPEDYLDNKSELINIHNLDQQSLLHRAVIEGLSGAVTKLMSSKFCDPNKKDKEDRTPLHYAVLYADRHGEEGIEILKTIIDFPTCEINEICDDGTPLHLAMQEHNTEVLNMLLKHSEIDVNIRAGSSRQLPLHIAVELLDLDLVKNLVNKCKEYGKVLKKDLENASGLTPIERCTQLENDRNPETRFKAKEILSFLLDNENSELIEEEPEELEVREEKPDKENLDNLLESFRQEKPRMEAPLLNSKNTKKTNQIITEVPAPLILEIKTEEDETLVGYIEKNGLYDLIALKELKAILDNEDKWVILANRIGYKKFIDKFRQHNSPTLMLLTYLETYPPNNIDNIAEWIRDQLSESKLTNAANVIENMLYRKNNKRKS